MPAQGPAHERIVKRYGNRKLYDPEARRYVTLDDLARMVGAGEEVRVVDQRSNEDLTTVVLAQVLLDGLRNRTAKVPREVLFRLIRLAFGSLARWGQRLGPQDAAARARHEVEKLLGGLLSRGKLTLDEAVAVRQEVARTVQRTVAEAQRSIEARFHALLERSEGDGEAAPALRSLRERLLALEMYLEAPQAARPARSRRKS